MASLREVYDAVYQTAADGTGLTGFAYIPDSIDGPAFVLGLGEVTRQAMQRGLMELPFQVIVLVPRSDDRSGQQTLMEYADPNGTQSVWTAFENDGTQCDCGLPGAIDDAKVNTYRPISTEELGGPAYIAGLFTLTVLAKGNV